MLRPAPYLTPATPSPLGWRARQPLSGTAERPRVPVTQTMATPPLGRITWPVMKREASDAR